MKKGDSILHHHSYEGFYFLEKAEKLFQENKGRITNAIAQNIIQLNLSSIKLLVDYPFFAAKAYRINGEIYEELGDSKKAIENYEIALTYNYKIGIKKRLHILDPNNILCKPIDKKPPFTVLYALQGSLTLNSKEKSCSAGQAPRGSYYAVTHGVDSCVYIKNHYKNIDSLLGTASVSCTTNYGIFLDKIEFNHLIFKFACTSYQGLSASISFDLKLYLHFPGNLANEMRDISSDVLRRDQIKCLLLSKNGDNIYYSNRGTLYILDRRLVLINQWKNYIDDSTHDSTEKFPNKALSILGLSGNPSNDEIKSAYRKRLFQVHPDLNRDNPDANDETRKVIFAYETLSNDEHRSENSNYHINVFQGLRVYFPAFEDEIYSLHLSKNNGDIYVGYYSGKIIVLHNSGLSEQYYRSDKSIVNITEISDYLYFVSNKIEIFKNHRLINTVSSTESFYRCYWGENAFVVSYGRILVLHMLDGTIFAKIEFRDSIADVYIIDHKLKVVTVKKIYEFNIHLNYKGLYIN